MLQIKTKINASPLGLKHTTYLCKPYPHQLLRNIRDWVTVPKDFYWRNINHVKHTKAFVIKINLNFDIPLLSFERSLISNFLAVVTGHGLFEVYLKKLKLAEETDCPKCGQESDTALLFLTTNQYYNTAQKQTFGSSVLEGASMYE